MGKTYRYVVMVRYSYSMDLFNPIFYFFFLQPLYLYLVDSSGISQNNPGFQLFVCFNLKKTLIFDYLVVAQFYKHTLNEQRIQTRF